MRIILTILLFSLQSCFKELHEQPTPAHCPVQFYTDYKEIASVPVFINGAFLTKLEYHESAPECGDKVTDLLWAAPGRYYKISYAGNELTGEMIDTMVMVKENTCTVINLNN